MARTASVRNVPAHCRQRLPAVLLAAVLAAGSASGQYLERLLPVGRGPVAMALDTARRKLFVVCQNSNTLAVVDPDSNRVTASVNVGIKTVDVLVVPGTGRVYVACSPGSGNGSVRVYDAGDLSLVASVGVGRSPVKLVYDATDGRLCCLNRLSPSVSVIRCDSNRLVRNVSLSQTAEDILWNPTANKVYVASGGYMQPGKVTIINPRTCQVVKTLSSGEDGWRLGCDPVRNRVYCGFRGTRTLAVISGTSDTIERVLPTESEVWALLWLPAGKLYAGNYWTSSVSVLYGADTAFGRTFHVAGGPGSFCLNPVTGKVYAAAYLGGRVSVVDARAGQDLMLDSIGIGAGPSDVEVYPAMNRIFVCNSWDSTVAVIRDELTGTEEVGNGESRIEKRGATLARDVLFLPPSPFPIHSPLFDMAGRAVMPLRPGPNDVSLLPSGVYFLRGASGEARRVVLAR